MYAERIAAAGFPVVFAADGARARRLVRDGVSVNGERLRLPVIGWDAGPVDRIIVALKHDHLPAVAADIARLSGPDTTIISVMNGIESEDTIAGALGDDPMSADTRVLPTMVKGMDAVRVGSDIRYTRLGTIVFGLARNDSAAPHPRVVAMQQFLDAVGLAWETPPDMIQALWNKFMLNVGINQWSAVLRAPYGVFQQEGPARDLMRAAMREVLPIAAHRGVDLTEEHLEAWFPVVGMLSPEGRTSMLQDIDAGRATEVGMFAGRVIALADELGTAAPVNRVLFTAIRALEQMAS